MRVPTLLREVNKYHLPFSDVLSVEAAVMLTVSAHVVQAELLKEQLNDNLVLQLLLQPWQKFI